MPVATSVATCITEQINSVKVKKVSINSHDKTSVDVSIHVFLPKIQQTIDCE
jgi:hypothetical protein